jgi:RNA polymerase sigma factor (sigma-70 family)
VPIDSTSSRPSDPAWCVRPDDQCRDVAAGLLARHGWQLLSREQLASETHELACRASRSSRPRAALAAYSRVLHMACSGALGSDRRDLAYVELWRYLRGCAARRFADGGEDVAQSALERTLASFHRCRRPNAFLAFALQQLSDAARTLRRQQRGAIASLDVPADDQEDALAERLRDPRQVDPELIVVAREDRGRLDRIRDRFLERNPRAGQQLAAVWLKYVEELDESAISQHLGKPVGSLYVLRSRALTKLQMDPDVRSLARDRGLLTTAPIAS